MADAQVEQIECRGYQNGRVVTMLLRAGQPGPELLLGLLRDIQHYGITPTRYPCWIERTGESAIAPPDESHLVRGEQ